MCRDWCTQAKQELICIPEPLQNTVFPFFRIQQCWIAAVYTPGENIQVPQENQQQGVGKPQHIASAQTEMICLGPVNLEMDSNLDQISPHDLHSQGSIQAHQLGWI